MELAVDPDVLAVAKFMQSNVSAHRLVAVAKGVRDLAPILWGRYAPEAVDVLSLAHAQAISGSETSRRAATESAPWHSRADDDSVAGVGAGGLR